MRHANTEKNGPKHTSSRVKSLGRRGIEASQQDSGERVAAQFRSLAAEVRDDKEKVAYYKNSFERGLTKLVDDGQYHPRMLDHLAVIRMLPVFQSGSHGSTTRGYSSPGSYEKVARDPRLRGSDALRGAAALNREIEGNYLAVNNYDDEAVAMHELAHRAVLIGTKGKRHVLREPLTNAVAADVMNAADMDSSELAKVYSPHARILNRIVGAANLTSQELSYIISGPDSEENDQLLRSVVTERIGWNAIGFAQSQYMKNLREDINPTGNVYQAARAVESILDEEFQYQANLVTPASIPAA